MEFRKQVDIPKWELEINHQSKLFLLGSCFIENVGQYLVDNKFDAHINPFGVLYNPKSIAESIRILIGETVFTESDVIFDKGLYHSFNYHGSYSNVDLSSLLITINESRKIASDKIKSVDFLIVTFGTSFVYEYNETQKVVSNCHKIDAKEFRRFRLNEDEIVSDWLLILSELVALNPNIKILFTVSPIRHWKDGAHGNQLSKATLLMAIDRLIAECSNCYYFPSYEIMIDELRDYRFYADDMIHPSSLAIEYIWQRFSDSYFSDATQNIVKKWNNLLRSINHRPFNEQTDEHKHFIRQTLLKLEDFQNKYPYFDCSWEMNLMRAKLL